MTSKPDSTAASAPHLEDAAAPPTYEQATGAAPMPPQPPPIGFHPIEQPPLLVRHYPGHRERLPLHVIQNTIVIQAPVGPHSTRTTCPRCLKSIRTIVSYDANARTHLFALILCLFCFPCCILPYCIAGCKNTNHYCPSCGIFIGTFNNNRY